MAKRLGNNPSTPRFEFHFSKASLLGFVEHWGLRILFFLGMAFVLGSLLLTMNHIQSMMKGLRQTDQTPVNSKAQESVFRIQEKKLQLQPLPPKELVSPF